jgi:hypothetical protein
MGNCSPAMRSREREPSAGPAVNELKIRLIFLETGA